ncbi:MAG: PAS domain S-box protein, partial [Rhodospirillales bacterium]|nr:PAS domain S-box protein [Rhodospirillales bacterium]
VVGAAISSFHAAEAALRASRAHLQAIVTTAPDGVLAVSAEGIVLSANPAMERLIGRVPSAILGLPLTALMAGASLPPVHGEVAVRRSDGTLMPAELAVGQAELAGTAGYIVVVRDMARRKEAEARLREHEAELAHLSRLSAAGAMASALAHEINQPLAAVKTYVRACQRLMRAPACDQTRVMETMDKAARQADRAGEIIRRLREFLRKGDTRSEGVDLGSLLREAVALVELAAGRAQVQVSAEVPPGLPPMTVDGIQIQQVLVNLIHNSIEAMNVAGSEHREVMLVARPTDGGVEVGLADSGPGVAPEMAERLFSPFTTSKVDGLGLGLSISRGIVEAHGGRLWYDDSHGPGARFVFWLPASEGLHHAG